MKSRIMVVDDSKITSKIVSGVLSSAGYGVEEVNCPFCVAGALRRFKPHLVLMDLNMPGLSGARIIEVLSSKEHNFIFGVVVHSSEDEETLKKASGLKGVCGYIRKGLPSGEFLNSVGNFLAEILERPGHESSQDVPEDDLREFLRHATL